MLNTSTRTTILVTKVCVSATNSGKNYDIKNEIGYDEKKVRDTCRSWSHRVADTRPTCERLATYLSLPLVVVRRKAGDLIQRWERRWELTTQGYKTIETLSLILPFSNPSTRFWTSEMECAPITSKLVRLFPGQKIISTSGVRAAESTSRAKAPVFKPDYRIAARGCSGFQWNAIHGLSISYIQSLQ